MRLRLAALAALLLAPGLARAADPAALARVIDARVAKGLASRDIAAAPPCDDATFYRRLHLVLVGRAPRSADVRAFLADPSPGKRAAAIERLADSAASAQHFTTLWRGWLVPEALTNPVVANQAPGLEAWLLPRMRANQPMDALVKDLLAAPIDPRATRMDRSERPESGGDATSPLAFYAAKENKPENLAAATSRLFLGVQLECAQCHDHPTAKWTREQFWQLAAFFNGIEQSPSAGLRERMDRREIGIPNTDRTVQAAFLDEQEPVWKFKSSPRLALAEWVTAPGNPYFARTLANRYWGNLLGVGVVDPVDDFHDQNPPSHPKLLDDLTAAFRDSGFDARYLVKAICLSEAFQRSSAVPAGTPTDGKRLLAYYPVQGMSPEQLADSLQVALGLPVGPAGAAYLNNAGSPRGQMLANFQLSGKRTETQTSILQSLTLMNGKLVEDGTTPGKTVTLDAVAGLPGLTAAERVEALYLAALSRLPSEKELAAAVAHVEAGKPGQSAKRLGDVLWVLLNSVEFRSIH